MCALEALLIALIPNGMLALLIVRLGMCVTCFIPSVHVYTDVQYIEGHSHRFNEQTIL